MAVLTKAAIRSLVSKQIVIVHQANGTISMNYWNRAKALHEMYNMVNWRQSPYKGFINFIKEVFPDREPHSLLNHHRVYHEAVIEKKYTWTFIQKMANKYSYSRMKWVINNNNDRLNTVEFTEAADGVSYYNCTKAGSPEARYYMIIVPKRLSNKLDKRLIQHGMSMNAATGKRHGVNNAFLDYIKHNM